MRGVWLRSRAAAMAIGWKPNSSASTCSASALHTGMSSQTNPSSRSRSSESSPRGRSVTPEASTHRRSISQPPSLGTRRRQCPCVAAVLLVSGFTAPTRGSSSRRRRRWRERPRVVDSDFVAEVFYEVGLAGGDDDVALVDHGLGCGVGEVFTGPFDGDDGDSEPLPYF